MTQGSGMQWWYSQDEERWSGPCATRDEAIAEGRSEYDGEGFMVMEAEQGDYDLRCIDATWIVDALNDRNEELIDPDGDGIFAEATEEQLAELRLLIGDAIKEWAVRHGLRTRAWAFSKMGEAESIAPLSPDQPHGEKA